MSPKVLCVSHTDRSTIGFYTDMHDGKQWWMLNIDGKWTPATVNKDDAWKRYCTAVKRSME